MKKPLNGFLTFVEYIPNYSCLIQCFCGNESIKTVKNFVMEREGNEVLDKKHREREKPEISELVQIMNWPLLLVLKLLFNCNL